MTPSTLTTLVFAALVASVFAASAFAGAGAGATIRGVPISRSYELKAAELRPGGKIEIHLGTYDTGRSFVEGPLSRYMDGEFFVAVGGSAKSIRRTFYAPLSKREDGIMELGSATTPPKTINIEELTEFAPKD